MRSGKTRPLANWLEHHATDYTMRYVTLFSPVIPLLLSTFLLVACSDNEVVSYRVAKEEPTPQSPAPSSQPSAVKTSDVTPVAPIAQKAMSSGAVATASGAGLAWTAPANWVAKPVSAMRKGSYSITGADGAIADLSITAFPGDVGGEVANVNRWRGQLQLPPLSDADVSANVTRQTINGLNATLVDFANPNASPPQRIVGAMVRFGEATWFFKLMGPDAVVATEKPAFVEFLKSVKAAVATPTP